VPAKKPAPDIYRWVLERLGLPASACLAIEDSANGLRAAQGAGLRCLVTPNDYTTGEDFSGAWKISNLAEISGLP
jgi:beta-phosphoglucomutase-like phosphatase (HAD superfamily)